MRKLAIGHKSNWEVLNSEPVEKSAKFRDVYEEQQLRRSDQPEVQTMTSRNVMLAIAVAFEALFVWFLVALFETMSYSSTYGGLPAGVGLGSFMGISLLKLFWVALICVPTWIIAHHLLVLNLKAQNLLADDADINQHADDQHIALPMEVFTQYDWFPDVGAHSSVSPSTMISHAMLSNKGIKRVEVVVPGDDEDAEGEFYARLDGDTDELDVRRAPMFDRKFGDALFEASGLPKQLRKWFDPDKIAYNPDNANREKLRGYDTVADLVNGDWELPLYEVQRPAGGYVVDQAPVNTMVLAITRAGKGNMSLY